jgi:hypothetical protein
MPEMTLRLLAEWALRAAVLAAVVGAMLWSLRIRDVSLRSAAWTLVLVGNLFLPAIPLVAPRVSVFLPAVLQKPGAPEDIRPAAAREAEATAARKMDELAPAARPVLRSVPQHDWGHLGIWALASVWSALAAFMLFRVLLGLWLSRRLLRSSQQVRPGLWESSQVAVPVTVGLLRPVILLPPDWRQWEERRLQAVFAHEEAHVRRRDPLRQVLAGVYRSVCWFHPLSWWLYARLASLAEAAGDDAALATVKDHEFYAEVLLSFLARAPRRVRWEGVTMARKTNAMKRMERILDVRRKLSRSPAWSASLAVVLATLPLVYIAASVRPVWAAAQSISTAAPPLLTPAFLPPPAPAEQGAAHPSKVVSVTPRPSVTPVAVAAAAPSRQTGPDEERWNLTMSDGMDTFTEPIGRLTRKLGAITHFRRFMQKPSLSNDESANNLRTEVWREEGVVKAKLWVGMMKLRKSELRPGVAWGDSRDVFIGLYSITSQNEPLEITDLAPYGMPMLRFHLVRNPDPSCSIPPEGIANLTTSLRVEGVRPGGMGCVLLLRNLSTKRIVSVTLGRPTVEEHKFKTLLLSGGPAPGATGEFPVTLGQAAANGEGPVTVLLCVFDDGSYEGNERLGMEELARRAGSHFVMGQFVTYARDLLQQSTDESQFLESARAKFGQLPDADPGLEGEETARLRPRDAADFCKYIRLGMKDAKDSIARDLEETSARYHAPFREHWNAVLSNFADR